MIFDGKRQYGGCVGPLVMFYLLAERFFNDGKPSPTLSALTASCAECIVKTQNTRFALRSRKDTRYTAAARNVRRPLRQKEDRADKVPQN